MTQQCPICGSPLNDNGLCPVCGGYVPEPDRFTDGFAILHASEDEDIDPAEHIYGDD